MKKSWEKQPALFPCLFGRPLISPSEAFDAIVRASGLYPANQAEVPISFYIEEGKLASDLSPYLPVSEDGSVANYGKRISRQTKGRRFALIVRDVQACHFSVFQAFRSFLHEFYENTGVPIQDARATVFCGNYLKTPSGLHQGNSGNFKFIVSGRKRMRLWPGGYFRGDPRGDHFLNYEGDVKAATTLVGGPGDVIYWPSDSWHIGENIGPIALTISLALFVKDPFSIQQEIWNETFRSGRKNLESDVPARASSQDGRSDMRAVRRLVRKTAKILAKTMANSDLEKAVAAQCMNRSTACGFSEPPPPAKAKRLRNDSSIWLDPPYRIAWMRCGDREIICSANGHSFSMAAHPGSLKLVQALNRGGRHRVGDLLDCYAGTRQVGNCCFEATRKDIRDLLTKLLSLRAVSLDDQAGRKRQRP